MRLAISSRWTLLWKGSRWFTLSGTLMAIDFVFCLLAMGWDHRQITGVNAWLKPARFGLSSAVTCLTLASIAGYLKDWPAVRNWASRVFAFSITIEIVVIDMQAARGTTSHFNLSTPFDAAAYIVMGITIGVLWISMAAITFALMRQVVEPSSWQWALRLGLLISLLGAAGGGFMLRETPQQNLIPRSPIVGAHTVGAPDGGPGLPVLNWSTANGDLRIAHFAGLHAIQVLPLIAFWLLHRRTLSERQRTRLVWLASGAYIAMFLLLVWQALKGLPLFGPNWTIVLAASLLLAAVALGSTLIVLSPTKDALDRWFRTLEVGS
jgi:hypothetical protein